MGYMTAIPFMKDRTDTPTKPMLRSPHRTIEPEHEDQPAPINILRVVRDHAPATIEELQENIQELKGKLADTERELEYNMQLKAITDEYFK